MTRGPSGARDDLRELTTTLRGALSCAWKVWSLQPPPKEARKAGAGTPEVRNDDPPAEEERRDGRGGTQGARDSHGGEEAKGLCELREQVQSEIDGLVNLMKNKNKSLSGEGNEEGEGASLVVGVLEGLLAKELPAIDSRHKVSLWLRTASLLDMEKEDGILEEESGGSLNTSVMKDLREFCGEISRFFLVGSHNECLTDCATHSCGKHEQFSMVSGCMPTASLVSGYSPSCSSSFVML